ncbi:DUF4260 domain-containing protein [bacterium]|nr:DUF4260 domain-containing protein [bacterium]
MSKRVNNTMVLRIEAFSLTIASLYLYHIMGYSWKLFVMLILIPDVSIAGYLLRNTVGAFTYNLFHVKVMPIALAAFAYYTYSYELYPVALTWFTHINIDRMLGIGLKTTKGFQQTHLGKI